MFSLSPVGLKWQRPGHQYGGYDVKCKRSKLAPWLFFSTALRAPRATRRVSNKNWLTQAVFRHTKHERAFFIRINSERRIEKTTPSGDFMNKNWGAGNPFWWNTASSVWYGKTVEKKNYRNLYLRNILGREEKVTIIVVQSESNRLLLLFCYEREDFMY